jgi:2-haloacid dehalogenase
VDRLYDARMGFRPSIVFDLGGVLIDWNPRYLYDRLIPDAESREHFLTSICDQAWNEQQDAGRSCAEAVAELSARYPVCERLIEVYYERFAEMLGGAIEGTVEILSELRTQGLPLYALSNWSAETWPHALARFEFLTWFRGIVVSGQEGVRKPNAEIFRRLFARFDLDPERAIFIDDVAKNVSAARATGMAAILFETPGKLRTALRAHGVL